jgi:hypothetical protein
MATLQTVQILRTSTNTPPATLLPGALSAELGADTRLWIGSGSGNRLLLSSKPSDVTEQYADLKLSLTGGTLTGPLALAADPGTALGAATKQYTDTKLPLAGGTLTGPLALAANATLPLQAVPLQQLQAAAVGPRDVGRNVLHNSLFNVQQRGAGGFTTDAAYTADRWQQWFIGGSLSTSVNAATDAFRAQVNDEAFTFHLYSTFTGTAGAGDLAIVQQNTESVRRLGGKTVTVSFWAAGAALKLGVSLDQNFGTGGSPSARVNGTGQSVSLSGTFARYSLTFAIPGTAGKTLGTAGNDMTQVTFWLSAGSSFAARSGTVGVQSGSIALWGVQLEIGSVATPLEKPDPQQDLAKCQRFYQTNVFLSVGYGLVSATIAQMMLLPVTMRAAPTVTPTTSTNSNCSVASVTTAGPGNVAFQTTATATGAMWLAGTFSASADL